MTIVSHHAGELKLYTMLEVLNLEHVLCTSTPKNTTAWLVHLFFSPSVVFRSFTLPVACCSDLPDKRCDIHLWYLDLLTDGMFGDHMTARQRSIASKIELMIATKEAHVDVDCRLLRIYKGILRVHPNDGMSPTVVKYAAKFETGTEIDESISQTHVAKSDKDNMQVDNDQEGVIGGEGTTYSSIVKVIGQAYHPNEDEDYEDQTAIADDSLERESSAAESKNTEDDSPEAFDADVFSLSNDPSANDAGHDIHTISTVSGSSQGKSMRSFDAFSDREIDTTSIITHDTNRQNGIDETKTEYSDSERTRVTTIDEEPCDVKSIVEIGTTNERVGTKLTYSTSDSGNMPVIKGGTSDGYVITDISESSTFNKADPTDSTFDNGDKLGIEHRPPDFESTEVPGQSYSETAIQYQLPHVDCNIVTCGNAPRRCTHDSDCHMTHAFRSACLAFCNYVSLFHSTDTLEALEINTGADNLAELICHRDLFGVSSCSTRDAFPWLTRAGQCRDRLQIKHDPTSQAVCGGELVTEESLNSEVDNYTRHFVPFPISRLALCSVHRTSVIKRPTVDCCVILKNARCTERYICPIVSVCIEQCPANRKHYSLCNKTNETVFYHVCGR